MVELTPAEAQLLIVALDVLAEMDWTPPDSITGAEMSTIEGKLLAIVAKEGK